METCMAKWEAIVPFWFIKLAKCDTKVTKCDVCKTILLVRGRKMRCKRSKMLVYRSQKGMYGSHFAMFMEQKKTVLKHPASKRSFLLRGVLTSLQPSVLLPLVRHSLSYLCQCG